jgi:glycosyltransferase involved in cell wall biosynthesis
MKVVMVAPFARTPKATTRARVLPLARALAARGHSVTVLIPPYDNPTESGSQVMAGDAKVVTLEVSASLDEQSPRQAVEQPRLALQLVQRALALRPDVVHVFKPKAVSGLTQLFLWLARRLNIGWSVLPALVLDTDDWEGFGGWNEYEQYPYWQKVVCDWQERWGLAHADAVTVASRTLEAQAWSHRVPPTRVRYIPNGLDPVDYPGWDAGDGARGRSRLGLGTGPIVLLYTRFFEFGPERAWDVIRRVRGVRPDATLLVVGAGKFGQEHVLTDLAREAGQPDAVHIAGWQQPEALPDLLMAGDVAIFPADDNLANRAKCSAKVLELLWLRRPTVVDRVGQYADYVVDGETGLVSDPADPATMAAAALRLVEDRPYAARLAGAGHTRVRSQFGWDQLVPALEAAYAAARDYRGLTTPPAGGRNAEVVAS